MPFTPALSDLSRAVQSALTIGLGLVSLAATALVVGFVVRRMTTHADSGPHWDGQTWNNPANVDADSHAAPHGSDSGQDCSDSSSDSGADCGDGGSGGDGGGCDGGGGGGGD